MKHCAYPPTLAHPINLAIFQSLSLRQWARRTASPKRTHLFPLSVLALFVAISLLFVPAYAHSARAQSLTHRVQYGESLSAIAARYGVSAQTLASTNGIYNVNMIRVGQVLVIPGAVQPTQNSYSAPASQSYAAAPAPSYSSCGGYVVRAGDTLYGVARRYGVDISIIRQYNGLYSDMIRVGQCLVIPSGVPAAPAPDRRRTSEQS